MNNILSFITRSCQTSLHPCTLCVCANMLRDTSNRVRIYRWLCYAFGQTVRLQFSNVPNWVSESEDSMFEDNPSLATFEAHASDHHPSVSMVVLPRMTDVRGVDSLQQAVRLLWKPGDSVVVWQFNGVPYFASVSPESGTLCMDVPVGKMRNSVHRLFARIQESDEITKRKRIFTHMTQAHIDADVENDVV